MPQKSQLKIGATTVEVSNLDKVFYPKTGFTKGQVIEYYIKVSQVLLPHLKDRPISLKRYPEGVEGFFFYEKQCPGHPPAWIKTADVPRSEGGEIHYCVMNSLAALVWAANLADLELHTFLHRAPKIEQPTAIAFDLDPGASADILDCCRVGLRIRDLLKGLKLQCFPKTSGSKGLQIWVPLNSPATYDQTKAFAHAVAEQLARETPDLVVSKMQKSLRAGKVFVDWSQNDDHKTTVCAYSLRAKERPTVSAPVTWAEVEAAMKRKRAESLVFEVNDVLNRIEKEGDLFAPVLKLKQRVPAADALGREMV